MERRKPTLTHTSHWGPVVVKIGLIFLLFAPGFVTVKFALPVATQPQPAKVTRPAEKTRPTELIKIYSIVKSNRPSIADREAWRVSQAILDESAQRDLDPMLVLAVIKVESGFRHYAVSPKGARGIMQIMPETGKFLSEEMHRRDGFKILSFTPDHLDDPILNIKFGVYYLNDLKKQFRHLNLALLAYNMGPGEIQFRLENQIDVSDGYAASVLDEYRKYKNAKTPVF